MTDFIGSAGPIIAVSAAIFGPLSGWLAGRQSRNPIIWLAFGALLGPIAVALLLAAPPGRCPLCDTPVGGWPERCAACGANLMGRGPLTVGARPIVVASTPSMVPAPVAPAPVTEPAADGPIPLPVGRPSRGRRTTMSPPSIDRHVRAINRPFDDHTTIGAGAVLATAVYFGGNARLVVGSRYVLVRRHETLQLLGPVDLDPTIVALERPVAGLTATAIGERLVITEGDDDRVGLAVALGAFAGASGPQLEFALATSDEAHGDRADRPATR